MNAKAQIQSHDTDGQYIFTVSELNYSARVFLEQQFGQVYVSGEISNLSQPSSGHLYFSLKDQQAQIRCCFFRNKQTQNLKLQNGMQIVVMGQLSLYPERGDYQLIVNKVFDAGFGLLQQQFEALKQKLSAEGLFSEQHKKLLPLYPKRIGIITSETAAALQDVLTVLKRRFPAIIIYLYPSQVQGTEAPAQLIAAIERANREPICDVLLLTRGGGSIEDLWAFNDERLAYAIYNCKLPIVSAVGHEIDFTIADFVADVRAPTPSAAAELLSPDQQELNHKLLHFENYLLQKLMQQIKYHQHHVQHLEKRLQHPAQRLVHKAQHLDYLTTQLHSGLQRHLKKYCYQIELLTSRLNQHSPLLQLQHRQQSFDQLLIRLTQSVQSKIKHQKMQLGHLAEKLNTLSPLTTLERGFAIVQDQRQNVVKNSQDVAIGDELTIRLQHGQLNCIVKSNTQ